MSRGQQRHRAEDERQWQHLTDLLIDRYAAMQRGLNPRQVRDLIDKGRDSGLSVADFAATRTVTGGQLRLSLRTDGALGTLLRAGFPADAYGTLAALAADGVNRGAYVASQTNAVDTAWKFTNMAEGACEDGASWADVLPWLMVLAQTVDPWVSDVVWSGIVNWDLLRPGQGCDPDVEGSMADWARALGPAAGWAFAAGVPLSEAADQAQAGDLDIEGLKTLAALRGLGLPSPAPA